MDFISLFLIVPRDWASIQLTSPISSVFFTVQDALYMAWFQPWSSQISFCVGCKRRTPPGPFRAWGQMVIPMETPIVQGTFQPSVSQSFQILRHWLQHPFNTNHIWRLVKHLKFIRLHKYWNNLFSCRASISHITKRQCFFASRHALPM